jgi:2TM domain-containing protein
MVMVGKGGSIMLDADGDQDLRATAPASLKKKREFHAHLAAFVLINALSIVVWAMTHQGFFWPIFLLAGWGIGVFFKAWDVYGHGPTDERILREMQWFG